MAESSNVADIRIALGGYSEVRLFRFQCGQFELIDGRWITVGTPGMSDLLGWRTVQVTQDMVGLWLPVFTAVEVKVSGARTDKKRLQAQKDFLALVKRHGGLAGFAVDPDEARQILNQRPGVIQSPE